MKTQMQIVQEAIARLELMSQDDFRATLVAAGAVAAAGTVPLVGNVFAAGTASLVGHVVAAGFLAAKDERLFFSASMTGFEKTEQVQPKDSEYRLSFKQHRQHRELSLVF